MSQDKPQHQKVSLPSREGILAMQFHTLLSATNLVLGFLARSNELPDGTTSATDGGVVATAETTAMALLERIEELAKERKNWSMDSQNGLEKALLNMYSENTRTLEMSTRAAATTMLPHMRFRPKLIRHPEGGWMAALGDLSDTEHLIAGWGMSPEEALADFDKRFNTVDPRLFKKTTDQAIAREAELFSDAEIVTPAVIETKPVNKRKKKS